MKILFPLLIVGSFCVYLFGENSINPNQACSPLKQNDSIYKGKPQDFLSEVKSDIKMVNPDDILYKVEQRFINHVEQKVIQTAKTLNDIYPSKATENVESYSETELSYYTPFGKQIIKANGSELSDAQMTALNTLTISSTFFLKSYVKYKNEKFTKELFYAFSVVPKTHAEYKGGYDQLIEELRANTESIVGQIKADKVPMARVKFRVSEKGEVIKSEINAYSGDLSMDEILVNSVKNLKANWVPAKNEKGENISQDFYFFFGMDGC